MDKNRDRRHNRKSESDGDSNSEESETQSYSRHKSQEREGAFKKSSKRRSRTPSMSPPPRKKECYVKEEAVAKLSKKDVHRHRNYRCNSRERLCTEKVPQTSRDSSRSRDRQSSSKWRDRSTSRDRKHSFDRKKNRSHEKFGTEKNHRRRDNKQRDHHHRSKKKMDATSRSVVDHKRCEEEPQPKVNFKSPNQSPISNQNQSKEGREPKHMMGSQNSNAEKGSSVVNSPDPTVQPSPSATSNLNVVAPIAGPSLSIPTAVELPSYYNPAAINVAKYTTQIQKRKLLWSNKKAESIDQNVAKWQQTAQFAKDEDGKVASKFMRLMGIKNAAPAEKVENEDGVKPNDFAKKQADMFSSMEQQYEVARQATHTMRRGMGLGFSRQF